MLSLKDIFGNQLPVNPKIVESYLSAKDTKSVNDVRERNSLFFGNRSFVESDDFCKSCVTLTPHIADSHHEDCVYYNVVYNETIVNKLGKCPKCNSGELYIDSCIVQEVSEIKCLDCDFHFSGNISEDRLIKKFKKGFCIK